MKVASTILFIAYFTAGPFVITSLSQQSSESPAITYELYSWRESNDNWSFNLLLTTSRVKTADEIFNERETIHGLDKLKGKISRLSRGSRIVWIENLVYRGVPEKNTERLALPPKDIVDEVKRYAATKGIVVTGTN